jgi:uncharacterized protein (DUF58 family)
MRTARGWLPTLSHRLRLPWTIWRRRQTAPNRQVSLELQQPFPFLLFLILLGWYIAAPSAAVVMCLSAVAGLLLIATLWARSMALHVEGKRELLYAAMQVGDELEEHISLVNRSHLPVLWAEFVDRSNMPGYLVSSVRAAGADSIQAWHAHTICSRRGLFTLGPWELRLGEPFGLFVAVQSYMQPQQILVYPSLAVLPDEILPHRGAQGDHRPLNQPVAAETADSMSVRAYLPGDPQRHIHWPTTARRNEPFVKIFEPEAASRIWLVPDLDARAHCGEGSDSSEETAILLAASLSAQLLGEKIAVGLFAGLQPPVLLQPQRGQEQLWTLLRELAPLHTDLNTDLAGTLENLARLLSPRDLVIVITPSLNLTWVQVLPRLVSRRAGTSAHVLLLDPHSFGGSGSGEDFLPVLAEARLEARLIRRGDIRPLGGVFGELSRWEFTTFGTGKAVARRAPRRAAALLFAGQSPDGVKET